MHDHYHVTKTKSDANKCDLLKEIIPVYLLFIHLHDSTAADQLTGQVLTTIVCPMVICSITAKQDKSFCILVLGVVIKLTS